MNDHQVETKCKALDLASATLSTELYFVVFFIRHSLAFLNDKNMN